MGISTKTGDGGLTDLFSGERVPKDDPRVEVLGELDELDSLIAFAIQGCPTKSIQDLLYAARKGIEPILLSVAGYREGGSKLEDSAARSLSEIETRIGLLEGGLKLAGFVELGQTEASARIDVARAVSRRVERRMVALQGTGKDLPLTSYLALANRISDFLFLIARQAEFDEGALKYRS